MAYFDHNQYYKLDIPNLDQTEYQKTSEPTSSYNCIAWVLDRSDIWIDPTEEYDWPEDVERGYTTGSFIELFKKYGFEICDGATLESGYLKIAIYHDNLNHFHHVAKQLSSGKWTSKLGENEDIEHELSGLEGEYYGSPKIFMRK